MGINDNYIMDLENIHMAYIRKKVNDNLICDNKLLWEYKQTFYK